jgi:hypothetical protein
MSEIWLDGKVHTAPAGVIIEALWKAPHDANDMPVRGWLRHDVVKSVANEFYIIGPNHTVITIPPDFWRLQTGVPAPALQG